MITAETIYKLNNVKVNLEIESLQKEISKYRKLNKDIETFIDCNKSKLGEVVNKQQLLLGEEQTIKTPINAIEELTNIKLKTHYSNVCIIKNKELKIQELTKQKLTVNIFIFTLRTLNILIVKALIEKGYTFTDYFIGTINIVSYRNNKKKIDWGKSLKNRDAIIEAGNIPYYKAEFEAQGESYKGVKWLEYYKGRDLWFDWKYDLLPAALISNVRNYVFIPFRGQNGSVAKLIQYKKSLTDEQFNNRFNLVTNDN